MKAVTEGLNEVAMGSCWTCRKFCPLEERERNFSNFYASGGCNGEGLQSEEEAAEPFRECCESK